MKEQVEFEVLEGLSKDFMPSCKTKLSAGLDVCSTKDVVLMPGRCAKIGVGVKIKSIPSHLYLELEIRSGKRFNNLLSSLGTGVIDGDFTDEIQMLVYNFGGIITIKKGDRIGQLIIKENLTQKYASKYCLNTERNGGFGSTDKNN